MGNWNFPAVAGGNINSINNAGLETFRDNPIDSLTREICQNSLDAVRNPDQPVIVEFKKFTTNSFPDRNGLLEALKKGKETWLDKNEKSVQFIKTGLVILGTERIEFLRISDFNTIGLIGAKEAKLGSPWSSLIKEAGSSNKGDDSGGSFGIGKAAPFLSSNLRALFYSSFDEEGFKSHIGVADIMSFRVENNKVTLGKGYYTDNENSHAITGLLNLDPSFERKETGTDIFITSFNNIDDWEKEMIQSVLKNFFVTIYQKQLIVKVEGFEITHQNISGLIAQLEDNDENQILKNYYKLLTSNQTIRIPYPQKSYKGGIAFDEGEAELLLMEGEDLNRRVLMTRKNGMSIYEQNNISGSISFTGLLLMTGKNMNKIFKQMENPAHNAWFANRYEVNPKFAEKIFSELRKFLRDKVKETFQQTASDTMNAVGLSEFLPNKNLIDENGKNTIESIQSRVKSIIFKKIEQKPSKDFKPAGKQNTKKEEQILGELGITPGDQGGNGLGEGGSGGTSGGGVTEHGGKNNVDPNNDGQIGIKEKETKKSIPISSQQKYACANKRNGQYRFAIIPVKKIMTGHLTFKVIGEQSDFDLPIKQARFNDSLVSVDRISGNNIYFSASQKTANFNINIEIDYSDYCVMEVGVYEDK